MGVIEPASHGLILSEARIRDRISARLRARALDAALATGANPVSTTRLALRADTITRPAMRRHLAHSLERILTEAARPAGLRPSPLTLCRRSVLSNAAAELEALVTHLRRPGPVSARGVAQVITLLGDRAGPLHLGTTEPDLRTAVRQIIARLEDPVTIASRVVTRSGLTGHRCGAERSAVAIRQECQVGAGQSPGPLAGSEGHHDRDLARVERPVEAGTHAPW